MNFDNSDSLSTAFFEVKRLQFCRTHMMLDKIGIYPGQPPLLRALYEKDGQSQRELAAKLYIKPATLTVMLNRLERLKLVERRQDPDDQRVTKVSLTEYGKKVCIQVSSIVKSIDEECFSNFTTEEKMLLRRFFMQMRDNLAKACNIDVLEKNFNDK